MKEVENLLEKLREENPDLEWEEINEMYEDIMTRKPKGMSEYETEMLKHARIQTDLLMFIHLDLCKRAKSRPLSPSWKPNDSLEQQLSDRWEVEHFKQNAAKYRFIYTDEDLDGLRERMDLARRGEYGSRLYNIDE